MLQKTTTTKKEAILRSREWRTVLDATELLWSWSIDPVPLIHLDEQQQQRFRWGDHHFKIGHKHAAFTAWVIYIPHLSFVPKAPMCKLGHHPRVTWCLEELTGMTSYYVNAVGTWGSLTFSQLYSYWELHGFAQVICFKIWLIWFEIHPLWPLHCIVFKHISWSYWIAVFCLLLYTILTKFI